MEKKYLPRPKFYSPLPDGTWLEPEPDDYWTVITKQYTADGIQAKSWFYEHGSLHAEPKFYEGFFMLSKKMPDGRIQESYIPAGEILRVDYNHPSAAYEQARDSWCIQQTGMSWRDHHALESTGEVELMREGLRRVLAEKVGVPLDDVVIVDFPDGTYTAAIRKPHTDDES